MTTIEENSAIDEKRSISFVEQLVEEDLAAGKNGGRIQTLTDICTSVTQRLFAWTLVWQRNIMAFATYASTIQTQARRTTNMWRISFTTSLGLDSSGATSIMLPTILRSSGTSLFG